MTILLFTEDDVTGEAIRILAKKILPQTGKPPRILQRAIPRGDIFKPEKISAYVMRVKQEYGSRTKVIICVDSECTDSRITEENLIPSKKALRTSADFVVVVHALETWLLADANALRMVLGKNIKISDSFERECQPKMMLGDILLKHQRRVLRNDDHIKISKQVAPDIVAKRCASFKKFREILLRK